MTQEREELHLKFRPNSFDEYIGNEPLKESLLNGGIERSRTFLFHGKRGCGKTTLNRLIAKHLKISDMDLHEIDAADNTGVDNARQIKEAAQYSPLNGKYKMYIIDECFAKGTKILTTKGNKNIEDVKVGEEIFNIEKKCFVKNKFINKVSLDRLIKINYCNNSIFCSEDHLFFTDKGWVKAKKLSKKHLIFNINCNIMNNIILQQGDIKNERNLSLLSKRNSNQKIRKKINNMFQKLFSQNVEQKKWNRKDYARKTLRNMREDNNSNCFPAQMPPKKILFSKLRRKMEKSTRIIQIKSIFKRNCPKNFTTSFEFATREEKTTFGVQFATNEAKQSFFQPSKYRKSKTNKKNKWDIAYLVSRTRRQWQIYPSSITPCFCFGLANGSGNSMCRAFAKREKKKILQRNWISNLLQSGFRESSSKTCDRDRWQWAQIEREYIKRSKENKEIKRTWVESVEIYKRGSNEQSFNDIVTDKEKNQGYIELYDLEIDGHPSYYANGILVHNCHRLTGNAFDSLLKTLENPPKHCYFGLATTEINKVPTTIKSRAKSYEVKPLNEKEMNFLIRWICHDEGIKLSPEVKKAIIDTCEGVPREIIIAIDTVRDVKNDTDAISLINSAISSHETKELIQALLQKKKWSFVAPIIKALKDDPEKVRYSILGYVNAILLNGKADDHCAMIIEQFLESFMYTGKAGLTYACYMVLK